MLLEFLCASTMQVVLIFIAIVSLSTASIEDVADMGTTLQFVHVVFRHGDRTPDKLYPKDPYTEDSFWPFRIAHLTNKGKMTAYKIGTYLRKKYGKVLGDVYTPDVLSAISSHYPRARASLEAVLAGLYPPADVLKWNRDLNWEPIPYDYLQAKDNKLFMPPTACPRFYPLIRESEQLAASDPAISKYNHLLPFLRESSGMTTASLMEISITLHSTFKSEVEAGLELPSWAKTVYPDILSEISSNVWKYMTGIGDLKVLQPGFLVSQIINNTYATLKGEHDAKNRKIYLYSGHDANVAGLLFYLDNFKPHNPNYGAHIIIEVHKFIGVVFLKFLHQNYDYKEPEPLLVPNCGLYCPLEVFVKLYEKQLDPVRLATLCG